MSATTCGLLVCKSGRGVGYSMTMLRHANVTMSCHVAVYQMTSVMLHYPSAREVMAPAPATPLSGQARPPLGARASRRRRIAAKQARGCRELGGKIHNVSRSRARPQVPLRSQKSHVCGSGTLGAFGVISFTTGAYGSLISLVLNRTTVSGVWSSVVHLG